MVKACYVAAIGVVVHVEVLIVVDGAGRVCILRALELCYDVDVPVQGVGSGINKGVRNVVFNPY